MSVLEFNELCKSYGDIAALQGVSFDVREGEVFGLLGPNGAGKTTLIRILMDIIRPSSGSMTLFGHPHSGEGLDDVGYLPEERGLYVKHKVLDVMTYFGTLKGLQRSDARARARHWLSRLGLAETEGWRVNRLSKGMSQKVQLAAALMSEPKLCLLDEPFSGLDPLTVRLVQEFIHERRAAGLTTILSTHQMNMVESLCDRIALVNKGRLMIYGEVREVRQRYSLPEVRVTLSTGLPELGGVEKAVKEGEGTWRLLLTRGTEPSGILSALVAAGAEVERFEKVLTPIEDIFIRVVQEGRA